MRASKQGFFRRNRKLLIDEMGDACCPGAGDERLSQRLDGLCLVGLEQAKRHVLRARVARRQEHPDTADRERECASSRAPKKVGVVRLDSWFPPQAAMYNSWLTLTELSSLFLTSYRNPPPE